MSFFVFLQIQFELRLKVHSILTFFSESGHGLAYSLQHDLGYDGMEGRYSSKTGLQIDTFVLQLAGDDQGSRSLPIRSQVGLLGRRKSQKLTRPDFVKQVVLLVAARVFLFVYSL